MSTFICDLGKYFFFKKVPHAHKKNYNLPVACLFHLNFCPQKASAICDPDNMPGLTKIMESINWQCMFPISIAGVRVDSYEDDNSTIQQTGIIQSELDGASVANPQESDSSDVFCRCDGAGALTDSPIGIRVEFWEAARVIEVVKDAWCFPMIGTDAGGDMTGNDKNTLTQSKNGANMEVNDEALQKITWQVHYYIFPVLALMEVLTDFICMDFSGFDLGYVTEPDPRWLDSELALVLAPETVLFANPLAQLACVPDVMAATVKSTIDPLYWCQGGWSTVFPLTGHVTHSGGKLETVTTAMGRAMFLLHRSFVMWGTSGDKALCHRYPQPIWQKSQYKWQLMLPVRDTSCRVIGEPGFKWEANKNPPFPNKNPDNFLILLWRKRTCCAR